MTTTERSKCMPGLAVGGVLLALLAAAPLRAADGPTAPVKPGDFAYSLPLNVPAGDDGSLLRFTLLPVVYHNVKRADLGDIRVFNAAGAMLPYSLTAPPTDAAARKPVAVNLYPLPASASSADMHQILLSAGDTRTRIYIDSHAAPNPVRSYLVDIGAAAVDGKLPIRSALMLDWAAVNGGFNTFANVQASDDLVSWRYVGGGRVLQLDYQGHELRQDRIELFRANARYLRLSFQAGTASPDLRGAELATLDRLQLSPQRAAMFVPPDPSAPPPPDYAFDAGNPIAVQSLNFGTAGTGYLAVASVSVRDDVSQPWRPVASGVFYRLMQGSMPVFNPALDLPGTVRARYWRVELDPRSSNLAGGAPTLELFWTPQQVVFLAQPPGPYTLHFGNPVMAGADLPLTTLLPGYQQDPVAALDTTRSVMLMGSPALPAAASNPAAGTRPPGNPLVASSTEVALNPVNPAALTPPPPPPVWQDWKVWLAWSSLSLGVLLLGWMAWRLIKQMEQSP